MEETRTEVETILQGIQMEPVLVGIVMGSESDREVMEKAVAELDERKIKYELSVLSAHRDPDKVSHYASTAQSRGSRSSSPAPARQPPSPASWPPTRTCP